MRITLRILLNIPTADAGPLSLFHFCLLLRSTAACKVHLLALSPAVVPTHARVTLTVACGMAGQWATICKNRQGASHMQALAALPFLPTCSDAALLSECAGRPCGLAAASLAALATLAPWLGERCSMVEPLLLHDLLYLQEEKQYEEEKGSRVKVGMVARVGWEHSRPASAGQHGSAQRRMTQE